MTPTMSGPRYTFQLIWMKTQAIDHPTFTVSIIFVMFIQICGWFIRRSIVTSLLFNFISILFLLFLFTSIGPTHIAQIFEILDKLLEIRKIHVLILPRRVHIRQFSPFNEILLGTISKLPFVANMMDL